MRTYAYYQSVFEHVPKPFAFVDLDLLDDNARAIASMAQGKNIRIASKSIRCVEILRRLLNSDSAYQGIMCFTAEEAAFLAGQGFDDLLLGYPQWQPQVLKAVLELIEAGKSITLMVDSIGHIEHLERLVEGCKRPIPVCIDIDMSVQYPGLRFGVWRSPISSWHAAEPVVQRIQASSWLRLDGLMGYEAQVAGVGDRAEGSIMTWAKNQWIRRLKKRSIQEAARRREEIIEHLRKLHALPRIVNAGGTGSLDSSSIDPWVTEVTVGSGFYSPGLFDHYASFRYQPAAAYGIEIVRQPQPDIITCLGGGYPASGAGGSDRLPKPYLPEGLKLLPLEGAGEVQTPLRYTGNTKLAVGDTVFFRHAKAGELCERFPFLYAVSNGRIVDQYATYRGMGECFL